MTIDQATAKLGTSKEEEALAEYIGRLLVLPQSPSRAMSPNAGLTRLCFDFASSADVPLTTGIARIGDPDQDFNVAGSILWNLRNDDSLTVAQRLAPYRPFCGMAFVPARSHAREGSIVASIGGGESEQLASGDESVRIGSFVGEYKVEAFAWGSEKRGARKVLSVFTFHQ
jgi:hypothetical protein